MRIYTMGNTLSKEQQEIRKILSLALYGFVHTFLEREEWKHIEGKTAVGGLVLCEMACIYVMNHLGASENAKSFIQETIAHAWKTHAQILKEQLNREEEEYI